MAIEVDVQFVCDDHSDSLSAVSLTENIITWVMTTLRFTATEWLRASSWPVAESYNQAAQLTVRVVDREEGKALNETYRQGSGPTNVLSFPFDEPFQLQPPLLGDIVICAPVIAAEAIDQFKSVESHWAHMIVHGVLHLMGYDHLDDVQALQMESLEVLVMRHLGYDDPYQEQVILDEYDYANSGSDK